MNLEYEPSTGIIRETAIINYHTAEVILNTMLKQDQTFERAEMRPKVLDKADDDPEGDWLLSIEICQRRGRNRRAWASTTGVLDIHEVARIIQKSGIKSTDITFEHASCPPDLRRLRELLGTYGYQDHSASSQ